MSFQPLLAAEGYSGWLMLRQSLPAQQKAFAASAIVQRETAYFREKIGTVVTAEDLVSDRTLLKVALTAFGLEADLNSKAFIHKILSDGIRESGALANRLADKSYHSFSGAFGLDGRALPATLEKGFADLILSKYTDRSFEAAVGEKNPAYRLAMNATREVATLAASKMSEDAKWYTIMGSKPMRAVFETALGLPPNFGATDIDQQLRAFKERASALFGNSSISQFKEPARLEKLTRDYLIRESIDFSSISPARAALTLLSRA